MFLAENHYANLEAAQSDSLDAENRFADVVRPIWLEARGIGAPMLRVALLRAVSAPRDSFRASRPLRHTLVPTQWQRNSRHISYLLTYLITRYARVASATPSFISGRGRADDATTHRASTCL